MIRSSFIGAVVLHIIHYSNTFQYQLLILDHYCERLMTSTLLPETSCRDYSQAGAIWWWTTTHINYNYIASTIILRLHTCPGRLPATARNQATSGGGLGGSGYLYPPASEGVGLKERGSYVSQLSEHSSFFYVPQDIDIKRDGTNGLKCLPKH